MSQEFNSYRKHLHSTVSYDRVPSKKPLLQLVIKITTCICRRLFSKTITMVKIIYIERLNDALALSQSSRRDVLCRNRFISYYELDRYTLSCSQLTCFIKFKFRVVLINSGGRIPRTSARRPLFRVSCLKSANETLLMSHELLNDKNKRS